MVLQARALVASKWLSEAIKGHRAIPKLRVLDTSWHLPELKRNAKSEFKKRHIPGAAFFDIDQCSDRTSPMDHMLPSPGFFADYVGNLGIDNDTHVVVYDASDFGAFSAPRAWWMFRVFGHGAVSVLNGGLRNWMQEGLPVTDQYSRPEPTDFRASDVNASWVKTYEDIMENLDTKKFQVVDSRPPGRFRGIEPESRENTEPGHIPGSVNMPFYTFLTRTGHFRSPDQLRALFGRANVDPERPLCVTCGSGVTACHVVLAAHECEYPAATLYDGSWYEFYARAAPEYIISEGRGKHL